MSQKLDNLEICIGTYEEFLIGYRLENILSEYSLEQNFTNHAHTGSVRCIAANRSFLASGSTDETIRLFNMKKHTECGALVKHDGTVTCLEFYGDAYLLSGSDDGIICIWSSHNWQCLKTLRGHKGGVTSISVHPSGKMLLSVSKDKTLKTWNLIKGRAAYTINLKAVSEVVRWSPSGKYFAVAINNCVDVYDTELAGVVYSVDFKKRVAAISFLENNVVAVGGESLDIEVHDFELKSHHTLSSVHDNRIKDLVCWRHSAESRTPLLITVSSDGWIKVWKFTEKNLSEPALVAEIDTTCRPTCVAVFNTSQALEEVSEDFVRRGEKPENPKKRRKK